MVLNDKDLLQANATIIAGVLILLTIASVIITSDDGFLASLRKIFLAGGIIPFILSAIIILSPMIANEEKRLHNAKFAMIGGLVYLGGSIIYFLATVW
ncbi:MAG: NADH:ubiquinone oxidoreductase subunit 6 (subunit J) [Candidatus Nitrosomirales archaeon]|jgi:NADH:ubiquinone oxidoreductase subunit 6 (subunit J)